MTTIWKYELEPGKNLLKMPAGAKPLTVQTQGGTPTMWALVKEDAPPEHRIISIYGTGHKMPDHPGVYLGTFQMSDGALVWHVFDATMRA